MVRTARALVHALQALVALVLVGGVVTRNPSVAVNALLGLLVTLAPNALERDYGVVLGPLPALWVTLAVLLHSVGMLGLYDAIVWWDHLTHTLSASVVAGAAYAAVHAVDLHTDDIYLPPPFVGALLVVVTLGLGVVWETAEFVARDLAIAFGFRPLLVVYSLEDAVVDLAYNALGGLLVAWFGTTRLDRVSRELEGRLQGR
ncbi:hypothetical protein [Salarchaeum sp. JOR-1]|uniref:hypothetical protein n=1 Tax=Salarchaeum sp. JOR-1 TaxID=2599399 RepID=UPI0011985FFF|nr:hypothetical protein [Salarchaeum sp. JOR-1]QDX40507.1 hypothetical protein FQU85_06180 [Salarchaeum sp. JOR-1]